MAQRLRGVLGHDIINVGSQRFVAVKVATLASSHVGSRVTFEVLAASFGLEQPAIARLGLLVHYLDVGGVQPPEAAGIESMLAGLGETLTQDDQLLTAACAILTVCWPASTKEYPRRDPNSRAQR